MPSGTESRGDLIIQFKVEFPDSIDKNAATQTASALKYDGKEATDDIVEEVALEPFSPSKYQAYRGAEEEFSTEVGLGGDDYV